MPQAGTESLTLSTQLLARVRRVVKARPDLGYSSVTEYVRDAIRRALERDEPTVDVDEEDGRLTVNRARTLSRPDRVTHR
jgi:Arc/MetJ-type ribon-helix-helix transcriptional regulator